MRRALSLLSDRPGLHKVPQALPACSSQEPDATVHNVRVCPAQLAVLYLDDSVGNMQRVTQVIR